MTAPTPITAKVTPISSVSPHSTAIAPVSSARAAARSSTPPPVAKTTHSRSVSSRLGDAVVRAVPLGCYHLVRVGPAGIAGVAATLAAVAIGATALIAGRNATDSLAAQIASAQHRPTAASSTAEGIGKVVAALPTRDQIPAVMGVMLQQAQKSGVALDTGHYSYSPPKAGGVGRYELEFPVKAEYPSVRDFINRTLTAVPSAGLDKLRIERKVVGDTVVSADVRFVVFVRSGSEP
jgi:hypothetical protein